MSGKINGFSVGYTAVGAIVLWSGVKGSTISDTFQSLIKGQAPMADSSEAIGTPELDINNSTSSSSSTPSTSGMPSGNAVANQAIAKILAAPYGWSTGSEWTALVNLWNRESGWNNKADNPQSGAYGIAQALPPTKYPAAGQASGGSSASAQISWGLSYIKSTYGSPSAAWAHEESAGWY